MTTMPMPLQNSDCLSKSRTVPAATSSPTMATTRVRSRPISGIAIFRIRRGTPNWRRGGSRVFGSSVAPGAPLASKGTNQDVPRRRGAGTVFPENFAAGLVLADQVLLSCGFSQDEAAGIVSAVRAELNPELSGRVGI